MVSSSDLKSLLKKMWVISDATFYPRPAPFVEGLNVINDPKCNKFLNAITFCPKCNKVPKCNNILS